MLATAFSGRARLLLVLAVTFSSVAILNSTAEAATCATCHAAPGQSGDIRPLDSAYRNITTGAFLGNHQTHLGPASPAADCAKCHGAAAASYSASHRNTAIEISANINSSPVAATYDKGTSFPQISNPALGACSNVNCHFEKITPTWGGATFTAPDDCDECHGAPPSGGATGAAGSHTKHDSYYSGAANCRKCHSNNTTFQHATSAGHRNLNISFAAAPNNGSGSYSGPLNDYLPSQTNSFGSCSNLYCHSPGNKASGFDPPPAAPAWGGSALTCKGCHKENYDGVSNISSGSHSGHIYSWGGMGARLACVKCHGATTTAAMVISDTSRHVDGLVTIGFNNSTSASSGRYSGALASPASPMSKTPGSAFAICSDIYCHSTGQGNGGTWPPTYTTPTWGNAASGTCGTCHGIQKTHGNGSGFYIGTATPLTTGSHAKHLSFTMGFTAAEKCAACHAYTLTGFSPAACGSTVCHTSNLVQTNHPNYAVNVGIPNYYGASAAYSGTTRPGDGYGSCSTVYCHSDGKATPTTYAAVTWGNPASGACGSCHGVTAAAPPASVPHQKHMGAANQYRYACAECHSGKVQVTANSTVAPVFTNLTSHVDKLRNVKFDASNAFGTYSTATQSCRNLYCHSTGNTSVAAGNLPAVYNGKIYARQTWSGTVSCNSCHGRSTVNGMPDYTNAGAAGSATANSHQKHVTSSAIACVECHEKTTKNNIAIRNTTPSKHIDGTNHDVFFNLSGLSPSGVYDDAQKKCSATYCHGTGASLAWGGSTYCNSCHSSNAGTTGGGGINNWGATPLSAHKLHWEDTTALPSKYSNYSAGNLSGNSTTYRFGCASCHNPAQTAHVSGYASGSYRAQVFFGYTSPGKKPTYTYTGTAGTADNGFAWSSGNTTCTATYCHSNGNGGAGASAVSWATTAASGNCGVCHGTASSNTLSGKHQAHVNNAAVFNTNTGFGCVECHARTVSSNSVISDKRNHVNKFKDYSGLRAGKSYTKETKSCSSLYCHSNGNTGNLLYVNPAAWISVTGYGCNACHGTLKVTGEPDYSNGGAGSSTANSHAIHISRLNITTTTGCLYCHSETVDSVTSNKLSNVSPMKHVNGVIDLKAGGTFKSTSVSFTFSNGTCTNISCHGNTTAAWGGTSCLGCHSVVQGNRIAVKGHFDGSSHHIQGSAVTDGKCYQCHWEAKDTTGYINPAYHGGTAVASGAAGVSLVVHDAGSRPAAYTAGTFVVYTSGGASNSTRTQLVKINTHCISCHKATNDAYQPFGDGKTPKQYAWDNTSIDARYSQAGTTTWGKYPTTVNAAQKNISKSFSAHGNAAGNSRGWDTTNGVDGAITNTSGAINVLCFDCHNSHGSTAIGIMSSYSSATGRNKGGILKTTTNGKGGYTATYTPTAGGSAASPNFNAYNPGADLCFDCHNTQTKGASIPWGYNSEFGGTAGKPVYGYWDTAYFGDGLFGPESRYAYKALHGANMGGHFGKSSAMNTTPAKQIMGLCTPCHDPHGVSTMTPANQPYMVPLLKGTWVTSPYKEDVAPASKTENRGGASSRGPATHSVGSTPQYRIDQNTFQTGSTYWAFTNGNTLQTIADTNFAGLCIQCHTKADINPNSSTTWKSMDRIHNTVKGWGGVGANASNAVHAYTCSKCHAPHNARLPRLMVSNCLDSKHRGRVAAGGAFGNTSDSDNRGAGGGRGPMGGGGSGQNAINNGPWFFSKNNPPTQSTTANVRTCHNVAGAGGSGTTDSLQLWNTKTTW